MTFVMQRCITLRFRSGFFLPFGVSWIPNKMDAGNGSYGICRVIDDFRSPVPDP